MDDLTGQIQDLFLRIFPDHPWDGAEEALKDFEKEILALREEKEGPLSSIAELAEEIKSLTEDVLGIASL